ncbi:DUF6973 domain-containing protein [Zhouia sp. PK063]|uniref:DUF6973 domain-containing protein n=1 Tax=Zhouia sp. PK063 TaxID=3373602 RepID=UPI003789CC3A
MHPIHMLKTYNATKETLKICDSLFDKQHYSNNKTNAFRHAYWNFKIAESVLSTKTKTNEALIWAKKITDLHEEIFANQPLPKAMDLHNNEVGRWFFQQQLPSKTVIQQMQTMMNNAKVIKHPNETSSYKNTLVYLDD